MKLFKIIFWINIFYNNSIIDQYFNITYKGNNLYINLNYKTNEKSDIFKFEVYDFKNKGEFGIYISRKVVVIEDKFLITDEKLNDCEKIGRQFFRVKDEFEFFINNENKNYKIKKLCYNKSLTPRIPLVLLLDLYKFFNNKKESDIVYYLGYGNDFLLDDNNESSILWNLKQLNFMTNIEIIKEIDFKNDFKLFLKQNNKEFEVKNLEIKFNYYSDFSINLEDNEDNLNYFKMINKPNLKKNYDSLNGYFQFKYKVLNKYHISNKNIYDYDKKNDDIKNLKINYSLSLSSKTEIMIGNNNPFFKTVYYVKDGKLEKGYYLEDYINLCEKEENNDKTLTIVIISVLGTVMFILFSIVFLVFCLRRYKGKKKNINKINQNLKDKLYN